MRISRRIVMLAAALLIVASTSFALSTDLESADIAVVLRTDGKADVFYRLLWKASGGQMHGFYFQGEAFSPVWNLEGCYADIPGSTRVPLEVKPMGGGKYDIVLAKGRGFSGEEIGRAHV